MKPSLTRGIIRAILFLSWTLLLVPPYLVLFMLGRWIRRPFVSLWHRGVCAIIGMKVNQHGTPYEGQRVLLAGNHISYLDIPLLASCYDITFVAKADVASWPLFGFLARIAQTAFIERKPSKAREQKIQLQQRIMDGERLMIFPEGTSSKGESVLPFKSSLFEMIMEDHIRTDCAIQPVTISFNKKADGDILSSQERDSFAWYGDMTLLPHLWHVFCIKGAEVDIIFHAPAMAHDFADRKEASAWAETRVGNGLASLLHIKQREVEELSDNLNLIVS
ncbi:lysophospholipid acyltransferase family protein [Terasakiella sp. A23]|uniref:lysophospholipid acyltransferase family protein n=1 Tax=Terasakiella sp. FCG-A23 TaxID=3080561 RepID=UPI002953BEEB|nr:lysophospholipid acyltransferase family protein [Terasakiella sp. A23]MDV7339565.1 lysophospholipid acyltransferase family protein [Terasakiella sp. A23]